MEWQLKSVASNISAPRINLLNLKSSCTPFLLYLNFKERALKYPYILEFKYLVVLGTKARRFCSGNVTCLLTSASTTVDNIVSHMM